MYKNYFYLLRSVYELNKKLNGEKIYDIYSQEKNILFIKIPSEEYPDRHLLISTNPQSSYMLIKNNHHKAKRNVVQFFNNHLPLIIKNIEIAKNDRLVKFNLDCGNLFFSIRGNNTNVHLISESNLEETFKKTDKAIYNEVLNSEFTDELGFEKLSEDEETYNDISELKKFYPMISNEIKNEIIDRSSIIKDTSILTSLRIIVSDMFSKKIRVGFNSELGKVVFIPDTFQSIKTDKNNSLFDNYNNALQYYISTFYKLSSKNDISKELDKYFDKELSNLANKLKKLSNRVESGAQDQLYYDQANILLANIYQLRKGMKEISLHDLKYGKVIIIKLDPKLSPKENIDKRFEKAKDEKVNYTKSLELFNFTKQKYDSLKENYELYKKIETKEEIEILYNRIIPKKENIIKMDSGLKFKYWHYVIEDLYHVYVGRDSKSNDYLSIKFAKQNDYWFHARGLPGSHVILRVDNVKEGISKDIIKKSASLAAYHSKAKTAGTASVSYTFAKFVHKKKGMTPGKVILTKEKTVLVRPEIPKNCKLLDE